MKALRILQQNINWWNENVEELVDTLLGKKPHVMLFSEFCYSTYYTPNDGRNVCEVNHKDKIVKRLREEGYDFYWPDSCKDPERPEYLKKCRHGLICTMAIKKGINFQQIAREDIDLNARYIAGKLTLKGCEPIELLFLHAPQTCNNNREKEKENMLEQAICFWNENKDKKTFIGGDFNTDINGNTSCVDIFERLYNAAEDTIKDSFKHEPTWGDKRLDYALVSESLYKCGCETILIETTSDHKALLTEIKIDSAMEAVKIHSEDTYGRNRPCTITT